MKVANLVTDIRYGFTGSAIQTRNGVGYIRVTDIDDYGSVDYFNVPGVSITENEVNRYLLEDGDCIIARSGTVGKAHVYRSNKSKNIFASYLIRLRFDKTKIEPKYFGAFTRSQNYWNQINSNKQGGVQQNINTDGLSRIEIPLPDLKTQQKIAEILEQVDAARQKRKQANQFTEQFLQSAFLEMFGDPVRNEKGWEVREFNYAVTLEKKAIQSTNFSDGEFYVGLEHIEKNTGTLLGFQNTEEAELKSTKFRFTNKHILYGKLRPYLNKVCFPNISGVCSTDILPIKTKEKLANKYYIGYLMKQPFFIDKASSMSNGANLPRISPKTLESFKVILPPLSQQEKFASLVEQVEELRIKQRESEKELENLFHCLMQKYFG